MKKALVVFYSRTGHTREVAGAIAKALDADVEELQDLQHPAGESGYWSAGRDALLGRETELEPPARTPGDYGLLIIGTPVWAMNLTPAVRTYLKSKRGEISDTAFFCTLGGMGSTRVFGQMAACCGKPPVATMAVTEDEVKAGNFGGKITAFAVGISKAVKQ